MPRLELTLSLLAVLTVACADDTTAMTTGDSTSSTTTANTASTDPSTGPTSGPEPTGASTVSSTASSSATDDTATDGSATATTTSPGTVTDTTGPGTATDTTTTATTTEPGTTTDTTDTTGGTGVCGVDGESLSAELVDVGLPVPCGPLEFTGTRKSDEKGPVWQLDGCACGDQCLVPDPWTLTVQAPAAWLPLVPACPRIVVDRAEGFGGCEFVAISVWDLATPGEPAVYHAGHGFTPTQAGAAELTITPHSLETCDCVGCCQPAELWDLQFSLDGADITLTEGASGPLGQRNAINFESHHIGLCDAPLDAHWAIRKPA